ncbi:MAG: TonB family protein [Bacteroidales bacterium]|nr:TonB family protein [Bacteroidales bacterium]
MNGILEYVLESSICIALLWVFYEIFLRRDTRHRRNRYYLLGSMLFSAVVPLLNIRIGIPGTILPPDGLISLLLPEMLVTPDGPRGTTGLIPELLTWLYPAGVLISASLMITGSGNLVKLILSAGSKGRVIVIGTSNPVCFSAFGHIFISSSVADKDAERMINHEMKHIRLGHQSDLIVTAVITSLHWFNPAAWLMRRSLQAVHEYEADSECITGGEDPRSYQELLLAAVLRCPVPLMSTTFSKRSLLKNRIIMMTKKRTGSIASLKMILAIPLAVALLFMFSCKDRSEVRKEATPAVKEAPAGAEAEVSDEVFKLVDQMPVFRNDTTYKELTQWLVQNVKYPAEASAEGIQGRVFVQFIVDEQGNVKDPEVIKGADPLLDKAALEVIAGMPPWSPGKQGGKSVKVYMTVPISFALK